MVSDQTLRLMFQAVRQIISCPVFGNPIVPFVVSLSSHERTSAAEH